MSERIHPAPAAAITEQERLRWDGIVLAIATIVIILDQFTKHLVIQHFGSCLTGDYVQIIGKIITFQYVCNTGTAFSIGEGSVAIYLFIAVAVGVIGWLYWTMRSNTNLYLRIAFGMVIGGAIGNLIDRFRLKSVVDFVHFQLPNFNFPVFNVADSGIVVGMFVLAIIFWQSSNHEHADDDTDQRATSDVHTKEATHK